ncbi:MAG TPA: N-acyl-D-amino acid deacylase [Hellea balneolensis]|uniref:N-acyl-D-amino acid deacylase n=1 Tax=Hellea balneolensis TaxID=287478 RepID=A0A7C5QWA2_9PROT|nr:N-acyl-D-amino acid deacylase [Hellea balneolensis]
MRAAVTYFLTLVSLWGFISLSACHEQTGPDTSATYDVYIKNGTVVDGTGSEPFLGDVLVIGDKIRYVGPTNPAKIKARTTLDATGKIVSPGFIDAHAHGDPLRADNNMMRSFLRQGVTTVILGQDGDSPGSNIDFKDWLLAVEDHGTGPNVAALVGHGTLRNQSGAGPKDKVSPKEQAKMESLLRSAFEDGAYGLSTGLEYLPGRYADLQELNGLAKIVGAHNGLISSHIRSEDDDKVEAAVNEVIAQGKYAKVNVTHIKVVYGKTRAQGEAVLNQIRKARKNGMTVTADVYPYLASYGSMIYLYPEWAKREIEFNEAAKYRRAEFLKFLRAKIKRRNGPDAILISSGEYAGKTLAEISALTGRTPEEQILAFGHRGPSTAHFIMTKDTQDVFITAPDVSISTDGSPTMRHPRAVGSFPKVIEDYVNRDKTLPLATAIYKMTGLTAHTFGINSRGLLKPGLAADILVIDLENVHAGTSWANIEKSPSGFEAIIVNGHIVNASSGANAPVFGRVLRKTNED